MFQLLITKIPLYFLWFLLLVCFVCKLVENFVCNLNIVYVCAINVFSQFNVLQRQIILLTGINVIIFEVWHNILAVVDRST